MMERLTYRGWQLEIDPDATRAAHVASGPMGTETCTCVDCRNFAAARAAGLVYPPEVLDLLTRLGLPSPRETEIAAYGAEADGRHVISGWLHAVGRILAGPPTRVPAGPDTWTLEMVTVREGFEIALIEDKSLAPPALAVHPLIQVEFLARIPWILNEPDPETSGGAPAG